MDLEFQEEQTLFRHGIERFLQERYDFEQRRVSVEASRGVNPAIWRDLAELGMLGLPYPEEAGGLGCDSLTVGLVMEVLGRHLLIEPVFSSVLLGGRILADGGSKEQQERWLQPMIAGDLIIALAHEDARKDRPVRAKPINDGCRLDGQKAFSIGAPAADGIVVSAIDEADTPRLLVVPADSPGLTRTPIRLVDGSRAADIRLEGVELNADAEIAGDAQSLLKTVIHQAGIAACWEAVGAMAAAFEQTADYVKQREQFGKPIASFQVVQHTLAEMAVAAEEARAACLLASLSPDETSTARVRAATTAKVKVARSAELVSKNAVQLHGGMGVSDELPIASYFRKLSAFQALHGSNAEHLAAYAANIVARGLHRESALLPLAGPVSEPERKGG